MIPSALSPQLRSSGEYAVTRIRSIRTGRIGRPLYERSSGVSCRPPRARPDCSWVREGSRRIGSPGQNCQIVSGYVRCTEDSGTLSKPTPRARRVWLLSGGLDRVSLRAARSVAATLRSGWLPRNAPPSEGDVARTSVTSRSFRSLCAVESVAAQSALTKTAATANRAICKRPSARNWYATGTESAPEF